MPLWPNATRTHHATTLALAPSPSTRFCGEAQGAETQGAVAQIPARQSVSCRRLARPACWVRGLRCFGCSGSASGARRAAVARVLLSPQEPAHRVVRARPDRHDVHRQPQHARRRRRWARAARRRRGRRTARAAGQEGRGRRRRARHWRQRRRHAPRCLRARRRGGALSHPVRVVVPSRCLATAARLVS